MQPKEMTFEDMLKQQDEEAMNADANLTQGIPGLDAASINTMTQNAQPQVLNAVLPQPSLENRSPLAMPNFANKQPSDVVFMNNLFKDTPAFDPRVQPMNPDQLNMDQMAIESEVPKAQKLKNMLAKSQALRKPASEAPSTPEPKAEEAKPEQPMFDNMLLGQGMSKVLQGIARTQGGQIDDNADFYNKYRQYQMDKPLRELELKSKQKALEDSTKKSDPNSQESKTFRKLVESTIPGIANKMKDSGIDFNAITAADKDSILDFGRLRENVDARIEAARLNSQNRKDAREERKTRQDEARAFKQEESINKDIQKFQDKTQDTRNILGALNDFETVSGIPLDNTNVDKNGNLIVAGKKKDLPGVSIPGVGRASFYSSDARKLRDAASKIFNVELKSRSGAAVTDNELSRLRQEFSDGKFNTEAELVDAIKRYKKSAKRILKEQEAGYKPEVIQTYKERYDANNILDTSSEKPVDKPSAKSENKPKTVTQNGHTYTWNEEKQEYE